jgi:hypothetical protein
MTIISILSAAAILLYITVGDAYFQLKPQASIRRVHGKRETESSSISSITGLCSILNSNNEVSSTASMEKQKLAILEADSSRKMKFDISLAVILAGYSFEAYNEPVIALSFSLSLSLSLSLSHYLSLSLYFTIYLSIRLSLPLTLSHPLALSFYLFHYILLSLSLSHTISLSLSHSHSHSLILSTYFRLSLQSVLGKVAYGLDGTNITFTSSEYVQQVFSGTWSIIIC